MTEQRAQAPSVREGSSDLGRDDLKPPDGDGLVTLLQVHTCRLRHQCNHTAEGSRKPSGALAPSVAASTTPTHILAAGLAVTGRGGISRSTATASRDRSRQ
jgi:hypothetical protein